MLHEVYVRVSSGKEVDFVIGTESEDQRKKLKETVRDLLFKNEMFEVNNKKGLNIIFRNHISDFTIIDITEEEYEKKYNVKFEKK